MASVYFCFMFGAVLGLVVVVQALQRPLPFTVMTMLMVLSTVASLLLLGL